jgi:alkylation response protein AidB-like acyl-CoA dehydrogenase
MHLTLDILRLKAARYVVLALWLHLPLVLALAQLTHTDPMAPAATVLVLACLATCVVLRRSLAPLGAVLVALAFGGIVSVLVGLLQATPWQAVAPLRYLNDRAGSIYAGSNEIQRNILAKATLGL